MKKGEKPCAPAQGPHTVAVAFVECGGEPEPAVHLGRLKRALAANPLVSLVAGPGYKASRKSLEKLGETLSRRGATRVVIAGCNERLFGKLIREALAAYGIDPSLVAFVDLTQARGAGSRKRELADRFSRLLNGAVASLSHAQPIGMLETEIKPACLVIGGGVAGIAAAGALARRGVEVALAEKEKDLGGLLRWLNVVFPAYVASGDFIKARLDELEGGAVNVITGAEPVAMSGHVGDYEVKFSDGGSVIAGAIIVASGGALLEPHGLFGYGERGQVITQIQLERLMKSGKRPGDNIVMIQCVGSRNPERPYCSRICCTASIKNTVLMKERYPDIKVTILSRGFAEYAGDLDRAREMGVEIIRYSPERPPVVGEASVDVYDEISESDTIIPADCVVLAVPIVPSESTRELAQILRLPTDRYGFIIEPQPKLRPEEYVPRGIFVAGCAHWPATITESIVQGYSAASRAFDLLSAGNLSRRAFVTQFAEDLCRGCGKCAEACMHGAIELVMGDDGLRQAKHLQIQCTGCGVCVSVCPSGAFSLGFINRRQIGSIIEAVI